MMKIPSNAHGYWRSALSFILLITFAVVFSACNLLKNPFDHDDDHHDDYDHDVITTVKMSLGMQGTNDTLDFVWEDLDGVGGNNPNRSDTVKLEAGKSYGGVLTLLNMTKTPAEDMSKEVRDHADEHQVFYTINGVTGTTLGTVTVTDSDGRNLPLGLNFSIDIDSARAGSSGTMRVTLYHYHNTSDKNGTDPASETDVEVNFPVVVR